MSSLENMSLLYVENEKGIQDKLRLYLNNSLREMFVTDNAQESRDKIELMVYDINQLFNRSNTLLEEQNHLYIFNKKILYDFSSKNILDGNKVVKLNNQEITLLEYLIKNRGNTIAYETLIYVISNNSNNSFSSIETLRTVIKRLRGKLNRSIIENISKVGYRLI